MWFLRFSFRTSLVLVLRTGWRSSIKNVKWRKSVMPKCPSIYNQQIRAWYIVKVTERSRQCWNVHIKVMLWQLWQVAPARAPINQVFSAETANTDFILWSDHYSLASRMKLSHLFFRHHLTWSLNLKLLLLLINLLLYSANAQL